MNIKDFVVVQHIAGEGLPMIWTKKDWESHFNWSKEHNRVVQYKILATFSKDSPYQGSAGIADYEEVLKDHDRLVREIDVILNGEEGAAKQASLCDLVGQIQELKEVVVAAAVKRLMDDSAASPAGDRLAPHLEEMIKREPVTFFLVNILKYLDMAQRVSLRDALIQRTPNDSACITSPPNKPV